MNKTIIHTEPTQYHYDNTKWLYKFMYAFFFGFVQNDDYDYDLKPNKKVNNLPITLYTYDTFRVLNYDYDYFCGNMTMRTQYTYGGDSTIAQAVMPSSETGFDYFGARYYASDLSVWLSVDPLSDKYPSTSPFMYVRGNPVMLIDPNGMSDGWVENGGEVKWDDRVTNQESAEMHYGENAKYRESGYEYTAKGGNNVVLGDDLNFTVNGESKIAKDFTPVRESKFISHTVDQNYKPNGYNYGSLQDFVDYYSGWDIDDITEDVRSGEGTGIHFVKDPITDKYIDMKHMLIAGKYTNLGGLVKEFTQLWTAPGSAFNKQDLFSNNLGSMFYGEYGLSLMVRPTEATDFIFKFLTSKEKRKYFKSNWPMKF